MTVSYTSAGDGQNAVIFLHGVVAIGTTFAGLRQRRQSTEGESGNQGKQSLTHGANPLWSRRDVVRR